MPRVYERARVAHQRSCPIGELLGRAEDKHLEFSPRCDGIREGGREEPPRRERLI